MLVLTILVLGDMKRTKRATSPKAVLIPFVFSGSVIENNLRVVVPSFASILTSTYKNNRKHHNPMTV